MAAPVIPISRALLDGLAQHPAALVRMHRGIEKESLRVAPDGTLSQRPHPEGLGSPLTHPHITTDFSEAQLELITDVHDTPEGTIAQLEDVHGFVYQNIGDELLWAASMPCLMGADDEIPVGRYGTSNVARTKTIYRLGLGHRYGRLMQTISGIHYNFSLDDAFWDWYADALGTQPTQEFRSQGYFALIRNFRRLSWLLLYLFGASPALCKSFIKDRPHRLESFDEGSLYLPHATSLRMGRLGYQSDAQSELHVSYNSLDQYARSMQQALTQVHPAYRTIGVKVDGEYRQLNDTLLQIENEFYGTIRPKRPNRTGERPLQALRSRGVEYVEVRCLDLNPFLRVGIDSEEIRFLDTFLLYCLLSDSPADSRRESQVLADNQIAVVEQGRQPGLMLQGPRGTITREAWSLEILEGCARLADLLDQAYGGHAYREACEVQLGRARDPALTPSAQMLDRMSGATQPFFHFTMNQSIAHRDYFLANPPSAAQMKTFRRQAADSLKAQRDMEAADTLPFDAFLESYLALV